ADPLDAGCLSVSFRGIPQGLSGGSVYGESGTDLQGTGSDPVPQDFLSGYIPDLRSRKKDMRKLRIAVIIIFIGAAALFAAYQVRTRIEADTEPPVITSDSDSVSVSVEGEESDVFQGLSAEDNVDGDITDDIRVASMSN